MEFNVSSSEYFLEISLLKVLCNRSEMRSVRSSRDNIHSQVRTKTTNSVETYDRTIEFQFLEIVLRYGTSLKERLPTKRAPGRKERGDEMSAETKRAPSEMSAPASLAGAGNTVMRGSVCNDTIEGTEKCTSTGPSVPR